MAETTTQQAATTLTSILQWGSDGQHWYVFANFGDGLFLNKQGQWTDSIAFFGSYQEAHQALGRHPAPR